MAGVKAARTGEVERAIIRHCSPILMGCKPAALFPLDSANVYPLLRVIPLNIRCLVLREQKGRALLFLFDAAMLESAIFHNPVREFLTGMGYPSRSSLPLFLAHLQKQFVHAPCPHEVGLFLGYPLDDVQGFIENRGSRYKLCGTWKVYGDVEKARDHFRRYELCRERMRKLLGKPDHEGKEE
ncbi:MAG: DUF3793 family protein [Treponema sp.]|nr:DUF3793 family protein [Treponema sp.]